MAIDRQFKRWVVPGRHAQRATPIIVELPKTESGKEIYLGKKTSVIGIPFYLNVVIQVTEDYRNEKQKKKK